jgi:hypothetical protein
MHSKTQFSWGVSFFFFFFFFAEFHNCRVHGNSSLPLAGDHSFELLPSISLVFQMGADHKANSLA